MMKHKVMPKINTSSVKNYSTSHIALSCMGITFHSMHGNIKMYYLYVEKKNAVLHDIQKLPLTETRQTSSNIVYIVTQLQIT